MSINVESKWVKSKEHTGAAEDTWSVANHQLSLKKRKKSQFWNTAFKGGATTSELLTCSGLKLFTQQLYSNNEKRNKMNPIFLTTLNKEVILLNLWKKNYFHILPEVFYGLLHCCRKELSFRILCNTCSASAILILVVPPTVKLVVVLWQYF